MPTYIAKFCSGLVLEVEAEGDDWSHERAYEAYRKIEREMDIHGFHVPTGQHWPKVLGKKYLKQGWPVPCELVDRPQLKAS